jgi:hypothetical protein
MRERINRRAQNGNLISTRVVTRRVLIQYLLPSASNNKLQEEVPNEIGLILTLNVLTAFSNSLSGTLTDRMQHLANLRVLAMERILFSSPFPYWTGTLISLDSLSLEDYLSLVSPIFCRAANDDGSFPWR